MPTAGECPREGAALFLANAAPTRRRHSWMVVPRGAIPPQARPPRPVASPWADPGRSRHIGRPRRRLTRRSRGVVRRDLREPPTAEQCVFHRPRSNIPGTDGYGDVLRGRPGAVGGPTPGCSPWDRFAEAEAKQVFPRPPFRPCSRGIGPVDRLGGHARASCRRSNADTRGERGLDTPALADCSEPRTEGAGLVNAPGDRLHAAQLHAADLRLPDLSRAGAGARPHHVRGDARACTRRPDPGMRSRHGSGERRHPLFERASLAGSRSRGASQPSAVGRYR